MIVDINNLASIDYDLCGEILRGIFFDQSAGTGCYVSFDLNKNVEELPPLPVPWWDLVEGKMQLVTDRPSSNDPCDSYTRARVKTQNGYVEMRYVWDGDGILLFVLEDGSVLYNHDCKKAHGWKRHKSLDDYYLGEIG